MCVCVCVCMQVCVCMVNACMFLCVPHPSFPFFPLFDDIFFLYCPHVDRAARISDGKSGFGAAVDCHRSRFVCVNVYMYMYVCNIYIIYICIRVFTYMYIGIVAHGAYLCMYAFVYMYVCNTLQHTATHCNALQQTKHSATAPHCNTLQHTAAHCNTLQHTATHEGTSSNICTLP